MLQLQLRSDKFVTLNAYLAFCPFWKIFENWTAVEPEHPHLHPILKADTTDFSFAVL